MSRNRKHEFAGDAFAAVIIGAIVATIATFTWGKGQPWVLHWLAAMGGASVGFALVPFLLRKQ